MATFFGGEQLVEIRQINLSFTPTQSEIDDGRVLYSVPNGYYAKILKATIQPSNQAGNENTGYSVAARHNLMDVPLNTTNVVDFDKALVSQSPQGLSSAFFGQTLSEQLDRFGNNGDFKEYYLESFDELIFKCMPFSTTLKRFTRITISVAIYKKP